MGYQEWDPEEALENLKLENALDGMENTHKTALRLFQENLPLAAMSICHMAVHSVNEGMRFNAAKYVVDRTMGPVTQSGAADDGEHIWTSIYNSVLTEASSYLEGNGS